MRDFRSDLDQMFDRPFHRPFDFFAHEVELPEDVKEGMHSPMQCIYRLPSVLFVFLTPSLRGVKSRVPRESDLIPSVASHPMC